MTPVQQSSEPGRTIPGYSDKTPGPSPSGQPVTAPITLAELPPAVENASQGILVSSQQSESYTFELADAGTVVESTAADAVTFTIPPHSSVAFPVGQTVEVFQLGAGVITIAAGDGVTLDPPGGNVKAAGQYATIGLRQRVEDEWVLSGDLAASTPLVAGTSGHGTSPDEGGAMVVTAPTGLTNGQVIVVIADGAVVLAPDETWTEIVADTGADVVDYYVFWKIASDEPSSWTFTTDPAGELYGYSCGCFNGSAVNIYGHAHDVTSSPVVETTVDGCTIVTLAAADRDSATTFTVDSDCTTLTQDNNELSTVLAYDTTNQASAGNTTARTITPSGGSCCIVTVAIAP